MAQNVNLKPAVFMTINGTVIGPALREFKGYKEARAFVDRLRKQARSLKSSS